MGSEQEYPATDIAVVGFAGRFPGARDVEAFWENLKAGVESVRILTDQELREAGVPDASLADPDYVPAAAQLEDADRFDAEFFGFTPREAAVMDPQHRHFLECAWEALETAGYDPARYDGRIGVFGGVARNTYLLEILRNDPGFLDRIGDWEGLIGWERDFPATRVAYKLGLKGPAINVQTACSTSAVAIHLACQSLLTGESDMVLAGGARVQAPLGHGYTFEEGGILSPDGHCRAFDAEAEGTIRGSGVAMVVLKRLADAVADGDTVHAVVKGTAVNNDGADKVGFTAPSVRGQADVIAEALTVAGVPADTIGYVEAHGTGTAVGDPIEVAALTRAFRQSTDRTGYCPIGSVKSNVGHLDAGAGATGFLKCVLALRDGVIPPSLHYESPNPQIDFEHSPFFVNDELREWKRDGSPRRAGVSSFGLGGTNAHIVLEEAPEIEASGDSRPFQLLTLSARTPAALDRASERLAVWLERPDAPLADAAYTLQVGRQRMPHRRIVVCGSAGEAAAALRDPARRQSAAADREASGAVFMFPGQGAQHVDMGRGLFRTEPAFRRAIDRCAELAEPVLGFDLREAMYPPEDEREAADERLKRTEVTQPAVFAVEYALAELWRSWGIEPAAMIGHSLGEYVAACRAGVFELEAALKLVSARGRLMEATPPGAMASVPLPEEELEAFLDDDVALSGINAPGFCTVSGTAEAIDALVGRLTEEGHECKRLHVTRAFHSPLMESALEPFMEEVRRARPAAPRVPFASNVTGRWITDEEATDPAYWARHIRHAVRFGPGLETVLADRPGSVLIEVGPGTTLASLSRLNEASEAAAAVTPTLGHPRDETPDEIQALTALGRAWMAGLEIDWEGFWSDERRRRITLPTYPFERERHWIETSPRTERDGTPARITSLVGSDGASGPQAEEAGDLTPEERLRRHVAEILHGLSGIDPSALDFEATFLELGFESLSLTQVSRAVKRDFGLSVGLRELMNSCKTPAALVETIGRETGVEAEAVPVAEEEPDERAATEAFGAETDEAWPLELPLTEGQLEIWFAAGEGEAANCAYNLSNTVDLRGPLDLEALIEAVRRLPERHSALRATFDPDGPVQRIPEALENAVDVPVVDLSDLESAERERRLEELRREDAETPFDLESGPLFRPRVIRVDEAHHILFLTVHHIVADGWSCGILGRDVAELYSARVEGRASRLEEPAQFPEFVRAEAAAVESGEKERDEAYWLDLYSDDVPVVDLPADHPRPARRSHRGTRVDVPLPAALEPRLRKAAASSGGTFFGFLLAGFEVLLGRLTGQDEVVVGISAAGQAMIGRQNLVGHCVHMLPLRSKVEAAVAFEEQLSGTSSRLVDAFDHQHCTFGPLVGKLGIQRDPSRMPLVSVVFNMNPTLSRLHFSGLEARGGSNPRRFEIFDLFFNVVTTPGDFRLECTFNRDLFDEATVERWLAEYETLLEAAADAPETPVMDLPLPEVERRRLLEERSRTERPIAGASVLEGIEDRVRAHPDRLAVSQGEDRLTYGEVASRSDAVAGALAERGVEPGDIVGVCMERSPAMVAALLGVWKAGAAYLPLDPDFPSERLGFMLGDSGAEIVLTDGVAETVLPEGSATLVEMDAAVGDGRDRPAIPGPAGGDLAYVIYTSGSTGRPKGVEIEHGNLLNFIASMSETPGLDQDDVLLAVTTLSFDIAGLELWLPLWTGARVEVATEDEARDGEWLSERLSASDATVMQATPATWRMLLDAGWPGRLRAVLCGGEAFPTDLVEPLLGRAEEAWNMYGPTETTVWSTAARVDARAADGASVSIGTPIANTRVYVMDAQGRLAPEGVPGELWIGGAGVARGYHERSDLTAEKFVDDPFVEGGRAYRTGDLARWLPDGRLEHLGRLDDQVKVNGFRIELGEIEAALVDAPGVRQAVVSVREGSGSESRLIGYVVPEAGADLAPGGLRDHLGVTLPDYMIPTSFVDMESLPLTPNGKVDRKALPDPEPEVRDRTVVPPATPTERLVAQVWKELLDVEDVSREDGFFDLGGHSLLAVRMFARLREALDAKKGLSMRLLLGNPSLADLARAVDAAGGESRGDGTPGRPETVSA